MPFVQELLNFCSPKLSIANCTVGRCTVIKLIIVIIQRLLHVIIVGYNTGSYNLSDGRWTLVITRPMARVRL